MNATDNYQEEISRRMTTKIVKNGELVSKRSSVFSSYAGILIIVALLFLILGLLGFL